MSWADEQKKQILEKYWYDIGRPRCPTCNTPLDVRELTSNQKRAIDLMISCPRCDESWTVGGQDATEDPEWLEDERIRIRKLCWQNVDTLSPRRYSKHYAIKCPRDSVTLKAMKLETFDSITFSVYCEKCGRNADITGK